jgi:hypothetical protein
MFCPKCGSNMRLQKDSVIDKYSGGVAKASEANVATPKGASDIHRGLREGN